MNDEILHKTTYEDIQCYVLEQIEKGEEPSEEHQEAMQELTRNKFLSDDDLRLTDLGRKYLSQAIKSAREENRSALAYAGIITGFTITFFALVLPVFLLDSTYPLLFIYLISMLFVVILLSLLAGFCFWHGCSLEHGWKDLRIFNETGDSTIIFNGWILLHTLYLALFLSLAELTDAFSVNPWLIWFYFWLPSTIMIVLTILSWRAHASVSEVRSAERERALTDVVFDFIIVSMFVASGGERFFRPRDIPKKGLFILIFLSIVVFSTIPIVLVSV